MRSDVASEISYEQFASVSAVDEDRMHLGLAPALTPEGLVSEPRFFHGFLTQPQVYAQALLTLAEITRTRYYQYTPSNLRDPVFTAHGDCLRAEVFSACNGVTARLDLDASAVDGGEIGYGTTNVDLGAAMMVALGQIRNTDLMHLDVGGNTVKVSTLSTTETERKVEMPARWIPALGNAVTMHRNFYLLSAYDAATARRILAQLPNTYRSVHDAHWVQFNGRIPRVLDHPVAGAVRIPGAHRLVAARRLLVHLRGMEIYGDEDGGRGVVVEFLLPGGRLSMGLTEKTWRGFSGEGALLVNLTAPRSAENADLLSALLGFESRIDVPRLARSANLSEQRVLEALAVLAAEGRVGWDLAKQSYFHRELPHDPSRIEKDHPRLRSARSLARRGAVVTLGEGRFWVLASDQEGHAEGTTALPPNFWPPELGDDGSGSPEPGALGYELQLRDPGEDTCACTWIAREGTQRGPCKHILAARLVSGRLDLPERGANAVASKQKGNNTAGLGAFEE